MAYKPRKTEEDVEEVDLRMPESFEFGDQGGGAAHEIPGVGTVDLFDVVGMRGNLLRRMHLRCWCG